MGRIFGRKPVSVAKPATPQLAASKDRTVRQKNSKGRRLVQASQWFSKGAHTVTRMFQGAYHNVMTPKSTKRALERRVAYQIGAALTPKKAAQQKIAALGEKGLKKLSVFQIKQLTEALEHDESGDLAWFLVRSALSSTNRDANFVAAAKLALSHPEQIALIRSFLEEDAQFDPVKDKAIFDQYIQYFLETPNEAAKNIDHYTPKQTENIRELGSFLREIHTKNKYFKKPYMHLLSIRTIGTIGSDVKKIQKVRKLLNTPGIKAFHVLDAEVRKITKNPEEALIIKQLYQSQYGKTKVARHRTKRGH